MTTLKGVQEKWDSIEKENGHAKGIYIISIAFMNDFYTKNLKLSKAQCFLQLVKRADLQP